MLSEVDHFYHATAPYYSVIILLFAVARFLADYSLVFIHVAYLIQSFSNKKKDTDEDNGYYNLITSLNSWVMGHIVKEGGLLQ